MENQPKQKTREGYSIPVPKRKDFEDALNKIAKPKPPAKGSTPSGPVK